MRKVIVIAGTRPEAIKVVSVVHELRKFPESFEVLLCSTGQHREMLTQTFADFDMEPDIHLDVMAPNQTLSGLSARLFEKLDALLLEQKPHMLLVQGDTTSVQVASLAAFYRGIPVGHIEAGLRSHTIHSPFPEELNRRITGLVAAWHFAPTPLSRQNLMDEGVAERDIAVTGNTVIDALLMMRDKVRQNPPALPDPLEQVLREQRRIILVTGHRRESFGNGLRQVCKGLAALAGRFPENRIVYPVHPNPNVQGMVHDMLDRHPGIILCSPLGYKSFIRLMDAAYLIITDSGGIQEEAPSLGKPVLVTRDLTERPEGVEAGVNILVGANEAALVREAVRLLDDEAAYNQVAGIRNPYCNGTAGQQIVRFLLDRAV